MAYGRDLEPQAQESRELSPRLPEHRPTPTPHLDVALGFMQAVQSELQVGAPSRHHTGAGHIAELGHCLQQAAQQRERRQGVSKG